MNRANLKPRWAFRPWRRHSLVLMVSGLAYIFIGFSKIIAHDLTVERVASLTIALSLMPLSYWGVVFICIGLLACLSSRWPSFSDSWGYAALTGFSASWSASYLLSYFLVSNASIENVTTGFIWGLAAFMWWAISGLSNPAEVIRVVVHNGSD